jgi:hypothetical protein
LNKLVNEVKYKDILNEYDRRIEGLKDALLSFQSSYGKFSDDIDGLPIALIEYEYLNLAHGDEVALDTDIVYDEDIDDEPI